MRPASSRRPRRWWCCARLSGLCSRSSSTRWCTRRWRSASRRAPPCWRSCRTSASWTPPPWRTPPSCSSHRRRPRPRPQSQSHLHQLQLQLQLQLRVPLPLPRRRVPLRASSGTAWRSRGRPTWRSCASLWCVAWRATRRWRRSTASWRRCGRSASSRWTRCCRPRRASGSTRRSATSWPRSTARCCSTSPPCCAPSCRSSRRASVACTRSVCATSRLPVRP